MSADQTKDDEENCDTASDFALPNLFKNRTTFLNHVVETVLSCSSGILRGDSIAPTFGEHVDRRQTFQDALFGVATRRNPALDGREKACSCDFGASVNTKIADLPYPRLVANLAGLALSAFGVPFSPSLPPDLGVGIGSEGSMLRRKARVTALHKIPSHGGHHGNIASCRFKDDRQG